MYAFTHPSRPGSTGPVQAVRRGGSTQGERVSTGRCTWLLVARQECCLPSPCLDVMWGLQPLCNKLLTGLHQTASPLFAHKPVAPHTPKAPIPIPPVYKLAEQGDMPPSRPYHRPSTPRHHCTPTTIPAPTHAHIPRVQPPTPTHPQPQVFKLQSSMQDYGRT